MLKLMGCIEQWGHGVLIGVHRHSRCELRRFHCQCVGVLLVASTVLTMGCCEVLQEALQLYLLPLDERGCLIRFWLYSVLLCCNLVAPPAI